MRGLFGYAEHPRPWHGRVLHCARSFGSRSITAGNESQQWDDDEDEQDIRTKRRIVVGKLAVVLKTKEKKSNNQVSF